LKFHAVSSLCGRLQTQWAPFIYPRAEVPAGLTQSRGVEARANWQFKCVRPDQGSLESELIGPCEGLSNIQKQWTALDPSDSEWSANTRPPNWWAQGSQENGPSETRKDSVFCWVSAPQPKPIVSAPWRSSASKNPTARWGRIRIHTLPWDPNSHVKVASSVGGDDSTQSSPMRPPRGLPRGGKITAGVRRGHAQGTGQAIPLISTHDIVSSNASRSRLHCFNVVQCLGSAAGSGRH
jgi:hypothetical protein